LITAYFKNQNSRQIPLEEFASLDLSDVVWLDLLQPSEEEHSAVDGRTGFHLPNRDSLKDIEPSSRLHLEKEGLYLTIWLIADPDAKKPSLEEVGFVLGADILVSVRYVEMKAFHSVAREYHGVAPDQRTPLMALLTAVDTISDSCAEILEHSVDHIDKIAGDIFGHELRGKRKAPKYLEDRVARFVAYHRLLSKVRDSLLSLSRMMSYLHTKRVITEGSEYQDLSTSITHDVQTLAEHANFISGNLSFLSDATLGIINIEQNAIIKIFSIASVVFLPPTLVASIYGMNFDIMPELHWTYGYPLAIVTMIITAVIPFMFFRWKGWL
jgi:magnesium transporter